MQSLQDAVSSLMQSEKLWQNPSSGKKVNHVQDCPKALQAARHSISSAATDEPTRGLSIHFPEKTQDKKQSKQDWQLLKTIIHLCDLKLCLKILNFMIGSMLR